LAQTALADCEAEHIDGLMRCAPPPGNDLNLGQVVGSNFCLLFPRTARDKHLYICGGTGTGKSKFLENLIRRDT
jgi:hypothetical protein